MQHYFPGGPLKYRVTVERDSLRFSAAHFTTFAGQCEPLHGHNYDVLVTVEGDLTDDGWVIDFVELKKMVRDLCQELDHRFVLQRENTLLNIREDGDSWIVTAGQRRYVMPKSDVVALPIDNSTAECLAEWFCHRLSDELRRRNVTNISLITVGVEEAPGQAGWCTLPF